MHIEISSDLVQLITKEQAWHYNIIPLGLNNNVLELYVDESKSAGIAEELEIVLNRNKEKKCVQIEISLLSCRIIISGNYLD